MRHGGAIELSCLLLAGCFSFGRGSSSDSDSGCQSQQPPPAAWSCPDGDTCSPVTPEGLAFHGPRLADWRSPDGVAVGGVEILTITDPKTGKAPDAQMSATTGNIFKVTIPKPWSVRLEALAAGESLLEIVDPSNDELFGSTTIHSADISSITMKALDYDFPEGESESGPFRFAVGNSWHLMATLESADAKLLVDEGLSLRVEPEELFASAPAGWDSTLITAMGEGSGSLSATSRAGRRATLALEAVESLDEIRLAPNPPDQPLPTVLDHRWVSFCVHGYSSGKLVQGVEWTIDPPQPPELMVAGIGGNCAVVYRHGEKTGLATVTIHGGGLSLTLHFEIVDKTR